MNDQNSSNNLKRGNLGQFILGKTLGEGTFGKVKIATHITTGEKVAIKILEKIKILEESDKVRIDREIKILKSLMHKNIIQIYSVIENPTTIFLIMEYVNGGELFEYICLKQKLSELEACKFYQDIISGIEYLHKQGIVHRDLKPENLLLNNKKELKIVDFGLSNIYRKGELLKTPCGSPCYAAPEMILGKQYNGLFVDIWSSGIILFAMIFGYLPFDDPNTDLLYRKITEGKFNIPSSASDRLKDFIRRVLVTDPSKRIGLDGIKSHPWFNLITPKLFQGIFIKKYVIPVDEMVLEEMVLLNFNKEEVRELIMANRHNHITTTYYLILKKHLKMGRTSVADLSSDQYIRYINDPRSLKDSNLSRRTAENKIRSSLEISKDTVIQNTVETMRISKAEETVVNNIISSSGTKASNNKLKTESLSVKEQTGETNNPDFHNIYDEATNKSNYNNNNILTSESNANNQNNNDINNINNDKDQKNSIKNNSLKNLILISNNNSNNNYNNYCVTEANVNQTMTDHQNNILVTEMDNVPTKENNNNNNNNNTNNNNKNNYNNYDNERLVTYLETVLSHEHNTNTENNNNNYNHKANQATENKAKEHKENSIIENNNKILINNINNDKNDNKYFNINQPNYTEGDNSPIPEYLATEANNVATSSQGGNNTLYQETTENNINNNNYKDVKIKDKLDKESVDYSNYVCATDVDAAFRTSFNKNENNYLETSHNNFNEHEFKNDFNNNNCLNASNDFTNNKGSNIEGAINNNNKNNQAASSNNRPTNLKTIQNTKIANKTNYNNNNNNKSPDRIKNVIFDKKTYNSKTQNTKKINNSLNNNTETSYLETNVLNTESSIKRETNKGNFGTTNAVKNQYDLYLRSLIKTKAERFKKGFFNTSVSYEKSGDVRNRTFDNKMVENSKSKSKERSPINNNNIIKKNNAFNKTVAFGKTAIMKNKIEIGKKIIINVNNNKFQTNDPFSSRNSSQSRSKGKTNNNASRDYKERSEKKDEFNKSDRFEKSVNKSGNNYNSMLSKYNYANKFLNQANPKRDKRLNISCPENSEYVKTDATNKDIYIIKEDDEYKKNKENINKLKIPTFKLNNNNKETSENYNYNNKTNAHSRNYSNQIPPNSNRSSTNNSANKSRDYRQYAEAKIEVNSKYINSKLNKIKQITSNNENNNLNGNNSNLIAKEIASRYKNYIPNHYVINNPANYMNFNISNANNSVKTSSVTPLKYSNYANFKMNTIKGFNNSINNGNNKNNSIDNSFNASMNNSKINNNNINNNGNNSFNNSQGTISNKNGTLTPSAIRHKMLNISEKIMFGKSIKKTPDKKQALNNSNFKDTLASGIPIDKASLNANNNNNNKYKNININFYQNIIINNNNKKKNSNSSNNNSVLNDDEKISRESSKKQSPAFARDTTGKAYYNQKNSNQSGSSNKSQNEKGVNVEGKNNINCKDNNNNNYKITNFNDASVNLKNSKQISKRSSSLSGSINSDVNTSKTTVTSNFYGDEELKVHIGPVDLVCVFNQRPQKLREEVLKALAYHKISIKPVLNSKYMFKCQKYKLKYDLEIMKTSEQENLLLIKFKKTEGTLDEFKITSGKIIQTMKSS